MAVNLLVQNLATLRIRHRDRGGLVSSTSTPQVVALNEQSQHPINIDTWANLAQAVLVAEGLGGDCELNLTFIDSDEMASLNGEHMGKVGPTDVLSFPLDDDPDLTFPGQPRLLGDVLICPEVVEKQAPGEPDDEMALMVVHGVLHILGMDHMEPDEEAEMKAAEQRHLSAWKSAAPSSTAEAPAADRPTQ